MTPGVQASIPLNVRNAFGHAAVQLLSNEAGLDLLHIKGLAADSVIREVSGTGSDADVLVRPAHVQPLLALLCARGWQPYTDFESGSPFGHAATLRHPLWGFVDVHRHFPGIGSEPPHAFEVLWSRRSSTEIAGIDCAVPNRAGQLVILILNVARAAGGDRRRALATDLLSRSAMVVQDEVAALVNQLDAGLAFAAGTGQLEQYRGRRGYELWKVMSEGGSRTQEWVARVRSAPTLGGRARLTIRALLVNREHLSIRLGHEPRLHELMREFVARPIRGLRQEVGRWRSGAGDKP